MDNSASSYSCMLPPQRPCFKKKAQPSLLQRLQSREISRGKPNTSSLNNRKFYQNLTPNHAAHNMETPSCHIKKFTSDGEYLLCFSKNLQGVQLYHFKGDGRVDSSAPSALSQKFGTYFSLVYEKFLTSGNEVLCRDFCLQTSCGKFFIFASSGPSATPPPISSPPMSPLSAPILHPSFQENPLSLSESFSTIPSPSFSLSASTDSFPPLAMSNLEDITFYLVGLKDGKVHDKRVFKNDFIHLPHHSGVYLYNDLFSVLSVHTQSIHLFQILGNKFVEARSIGHQCYEDDDLELACQRELEQQYNAQICKSKGTAPSIVEPETHTLIPPLSASVSCHQYLCYQEAKGPTSMPIQSSVDQEKETVVSAGPIVGIKQRLLAYLFRQSLDSPNPAKSLGLFYQQFTQYSSLVMWKMQLLDNSHLLIKFGSVDGVVKGHQGDSSSQQVAFFVVYNMYSTEILAIFENSSREFAQTFEQFCEYFRACTNSEGLLKYRSTCSNNVFVREHLLKQKMAVANSRNGGEVQAVKRILSSLPFSPQSWSESPYFDKSLFNYDEKLISATERPKPSAEFPIKFYSRVDGQVQFRLTPGIPDKNDRSKKFASYVFHPSSPFVISIQHSLFQAPIVNFHFRA